LEDCLSLSKTIKELNFSGNNIGDDGVNIIITALSNKKRQLIQTLCLQNNLITSKGCKQICQFIPKCSQIEDLQLSNNDIDNEGAEELIKVLKSNALTF